MAFISEIHFNNTIRSSNEYVEITLGPDDDPSDFVIGLYSRPGILDQNTGLSGDQNEINLGDLVGTTHPDNPTFTIYTISSDVSSGSLFGGATTGGIGQSHSVALTDISAPSNTVIDAFSLGTNVSITLQNGAAAGAVTTQVDLPEVGESIKFDINGNFIDSGSLTVGDSVICFCAGSWIETAEGERLIEDLGVGDLIPTLDHGLQPIRWIGSRHISVDELAEKPELRPIRISKRALGENLPRYDLMVSPQHRMLLTSKIVKRMLCVDETLVAAKKMTDTDGITVVDGESPVVYFHILFDKHEIIWANGACSESLLIGSEAKKSLLPEQITEINAIFPKLMEPNLCAIPAKSILQKRSTVANLIKRHKENRVPLAVFEKQVVR